MIAYELREAYRGTVEQVLTVDSDGNPVDTRTVDVYSGGVLRAGDEDLDVKAELAKGDGRIVIDDADPHSQAAVIVLDAYPALKRVAAGDAEPTLDPLDGLSSAELRAEARRLDVTVEAGTKVDELRAGLKTFTARTAAGEDLAPSETRTVSIKADGTLDVVATTSPEA